MSASLDEVIRRRFIEHPQAGATPRQVLTDLINAELPLLDSIAMDDHVERMMAALMGLGPLDPLLRDPTITDILVNGPGNIWVERDGHLVETDQPITGAEIQMVLERAFGRTGLSIDRAHPVADGRLADGSRISAVLPPLAIDGVQIAIRRFSRAPLPLEAFCSTEVATVLRGHIAERRNMVVFGPTGSGKTSLVNALAGEIDPRERLITIEDAAELRIALPHVVRLEGRPSNGDGAGRADTRMLVRAALRLRPDRIIVGEVRGPEALDMIWAMATGHDGSLSTCHAKSAVDVLARLETFVMLADSALPLHAVRAQVRTAVDMVVGVRRHGAVRRIDSVHEVLDDPDDRPGVRALVREGRLVTPGVRANAS